MKLRTLRRLIERFTGFDIEFQGGALVLFPARKRQEVWFSYRAQLRALLEREHVDLVLDVGANEGQFARSLRAFYAGEIISFEPVSAAFVKLAQAAASDTNWQVNRFALGEEAASQTIHVSNRTAFSSLLMPNDFCARRFGDEAAPMREERIEVRRLDRFLEENVPDIGKRRVFLKMDTQGYDAKVFSGIGRFVSQVVAMHSELSLIPLYEGMTHWLESIAVYGSAGFSVAGTFPVSRDSGAVIEYDCLFVRR